MYLKNCIESFGTTFTEYKNWAIDNTHPRIKEIATRIGKSTPCQAIRNNVRTIGICFSTLAVVSIVIYVARKAFSFWQEYKDLKGQLITINTEQAALKLQLQEEKEENEPLKKQIELLKASVGRANEPNEAEMQRLQKLNSDLAIQVEGDLKKLEEVKKQLQVIQEQNNQLQKENHEVKAALERAKNEPAAEEASLLDQKNPIETPHGESQSTSTSKVQPQNPGQKKPSQSRLLLRQYRKDIEKLKKTNAELAQFCHELVGLRETITTRNETIEELEEEIEEIEEELDKLKEENLKLKSSGDASSKVAGLEKEVEQLLGLLRQREEEITGLKKRYTTPTLQHRKLAVQQDTNERFRPSTPEGTSPKKPQPPYRPTNRPRPKMQDLSTSEHQAP